MKILVFSVTLFLAQGFPSLDAYPDGAPAKTCVEGGFPHHHGVSPQITTAPFVIEVNQTDYSPGDVIEVVLKSTEPGEAFKGFQLHAQRTGGDTEEVIGRFVQVPDEAQMQSWYHDDLTQENCVTHVDNDDKRHIRVTWQAPSSSQGDVIFRSSFIKDFETFWLDVKSPAIHANLRDESPQYESEVTGGVAPLTISGQCGVTKGCFLYPSGCSDENECEYVVAYSYLADTQLVHFQILGGDDDYIAIGFSGDDAMTDDETYHCIEKDGMTSLYHGYSPGMFNNRHRLSGVSHVTVGREDGRITCSFQRPVNVTVHYYDHDEQATTEKMFDLTKEWYLQVAWGSIFEGTDVPMKHRELPITSSQKVNFMKFESVSGELLALEIKVHGLLGLLAWFACAGFGMILARHFRQELKKPLFGIGLWFQMHRSAMLLTFLCSVTGIIIMFVHLRGWTQNKEAEVHAILGLVATSLGLLNIIAGFFRPGLTSKWRPFFNWAHRFGAVSSVTLAVACAFLGVNFDFFKEELARRETITLAVWVGVQIAWVLVLEILSCLSKPASDEPPASKTAMEVQDASSSGTRQGISVKLVCLALFSVCQLSFLTTAVYFLYDDY